jgi:hypothetical protein
MLIGWCGSQADELDSTLFSGVVLICMFVGYLITDSFTDTFEMQVLHIYQTQ